MAKDTRACFPTSRKKKDDGKPDEEEAGVAPRAAPARARVTDRGETQKKYGMK
jgi:hypothetical protein